MSAEDKSREININQGNYNEYIQGHYINGDFIQIINLPQAKLGFPQNIPRSNTDKFVGRQKELIRLHEQLQNEGSATIAHIEGMGGIGKTEMAIVYSLTNLECNIYPGGICWLRCRKENIGLKIVEFARTKLNLEPPEDLELPAKVNWCWTNWQEGNTLIVLDDVTDYESIKPYLPPQSSQFKILITTRLKLELVNTLYLEVLSETEALELLAELVSSEKVEQELGTAQELCQRLGYLPLALQLVGRYVKRRRISLAEELRRLEGKGLAHPSMKVPENKTNWAVDIERGVAAAFELSWEELTEAAQDLGCLISLFALAPIPWSLVESSAVGQDPEELEDLRIELENLHLLQAGESYQLHQLIQEFFRDKQKSLANAEEQKANLCNAVVEIAKEIPQHLTLKEVNYFAPFIPHFAETASFYKGSLSDNDLIAPFEGLGRFYEGQGVYKQSLPWYKQSLFATKERFGESHTSVAISLNNLALLYYAQGRYEEAEPFYSQALALNKELLGESHPNVAMNLNNLAYLYMEQGRYEEAEPLFLQALELYKKLLGESDIYVAMSCNNIALLYYAQGRYEEAEPLFLQTLELGKELLGESHPNILKTLNNLAYLYKEQGRYEEAEPLFLQALALNKELLGELHPNVAMNLNNVALLYHDQGRYEQAEPLFLQALELHKKLLGELHPDVALSLNNLALLYYAQERYEEAEPLFLQALELNKELLGESHPQVAITLNNIALLYNNQERYEEAETLFLQALEIAKVALGENHPNTNLYRNNLQGLLENKKNKE